ncbi:hypothetical protein OUZ56_019562 [Daphnia magna]|uniref:Uncharacterized protein n=1 Tax=Daphnia magna TaxID=35525 RepID=A0ABQ9ZD03_9CRUS|nr:hypothetical protein OUZ56_019562 [Daphnia magna]
MTPFQFFILKRMQSAVTRDVDWISSKNYHFTDNSSPTSTLGTILQQAHPKSKFDHQFSLPSSFIRIGKTRADRGRRFPHYDLKSSICIFPLRFAAGAEMLIVQALSVALMSITTAPETLEQYHHGGAIKPFIRPGPYKCRRLNSK